MRSLVGIVTAALLLGVVSTASAQTVESGVVIRTDPQSNVVVLDDGRMYRVTPNTILVVDNRPTQLATLRPGQRVMVQSGEVVVLRDGQYVTLTPAPSASVVTQAPVGTVITQAPVSPPTAVAQAPVTVSPAGVRQTIYGRVAEVERNGEVKIRTEADTFEVKLNPDAMRHLKKGDTVTIDLTFTPPGAPSALPR